MNKFKGYGGEKQIFFKDDEMTGDKVMVWGRERRDDGESDEL